MREGGYGLGSLTFVTYYICYVYADKIGKGGKGNYEVVELGRKGQEKLL